jgi:signal transduction histidine kinase
MRLPFKIWHKSLLLVAVPLVFELVFISTLAVMLDQAENEAKRLAWARHVVVASNDLMRSFIAAVKDITEPFLSGAETDMESYNAHIQNVHDDFRDLKKLHESDPTAFAKLEKLEGVSEQIIVLTKEFLALQREGRRREAVMKLTGLKELFASMESVSDEVTVEAVRIEKTLPQIQSAQREKTATILLGGLGINVLLAIYLGFAFNRHITSRLSELVENTRRFRAGQELKPAQPGQDELSILDRTFRDMADALRIAAANQRTALNEIKTIVQTMPVGLLITDAGGSVIDANETLSGLLQVPTREMVGSDAPQMFSLPGFKVLLEKASGQVWQTELTAAGESKTTIPVEVSMSAATIGGADRWLVVIADATAQRKLERMREEFLSMVTHDLRTPLASIQMFLEMVAMACYADVPDQYVGRAGLVQGETERLMSLVNNLLDFEKLNAGKMQLFFQTTPSGELVDRAMIAVEEKAKIAGVQLVNDDCGAQVYGDADRLVQVLVNLLQNAIEHSPTDSLVTIKVSDSNEYTQFRVVDHGKGISQAQLTTLFERLKFDATTASRRITFGLPLCKAIVDQHGGFIKAESEVGKGTTIVITIPKAAVGASPSPVAVAGAGEVTP